jgi:hypothetical protein
MLNGIFGNATELNPTELNKEFEPVLIDGEQIERAFKLVRDLYVFTNKRLVLVDKQGATGKKVEYHSIPYDKITHFAVETAGRFDRDAEMKIWVSGSSHSITKEFKKGTDIIGVQKTLAQYILG